MSSQWTTTFNFRNTTNKEITTKRYFVRIPCVFSMLVFRVLEVFPFLFLEGFPCFRGFSCFFLEGFLALEVLRAFSLNVFRALEVFRAFPLGVSVL
jgi:hypothetical protein